MSSAHTGVTGPPRPTSPAALRRVVAASLIGTTVEWYDYFLYGSAAALVFGKVFFPHSDPLTGTLLSFLTYAIGFAARPIGALVFGHFGDRIGRKRLLVLSLLMMGGATTLIGCVPSYNSIGVAAPVLLTTLRVIQGFALGGEWGGAVLLVSEHGDAKRRGFWASWPQGGAPAGNLIAVGVLSLMTTVQSDATFTAWGWRIPFLFSAVLVGIGLWIRLSVDESPLFKDALAKAEQRKAADDQDAAARDGERLAGPRGLVDRMPGLAVLRDHWRDVLVAMGARMAENISYYVITTFVLAYCVDHLEIHKQTALNAVLIGSGVQFCLIP
ncbi:MAG TPA: MFS transporter, partial [Streptomyces sp.]